MNSSIDSSVLLERKTISNNIVESKIQIGKDIINIKSSFTGDKKYSDLLFELACQKLSA